MARRSTYGFWYRLAAVIAKPPLIALAKRDWRGTEHIPAEGGFLTAVNHNSYLDTVVYPHFQYNTGRPARLLAKSSLFKVPGLKWVLNGTRMIPVYRGTAAAGDAFHAAIKALEEGECVAFFPEGTLTRDPDLWPMTGKTGIARVALATGAPVIPIAQWGGHRIVPPYAKGGKEDPRLRVFPRGTVHVLAGPPVDLSRFEGREVTPDLLREATDVVMDAITALLEELRGEKAPEGRWDMRLKRRVPRLSSAAAAADAPAQDAAAPAAGEAAPASPDAELPAVGAESDEAEAADAAGEATATAPAAAGTAAGTGDAEGAPADDGEAAGAAAARSGAAAQADADAARRNAAGAARTDGAEADDAAAQANAGDGVAPGEGAAR